jgi:hypothetical protein
MSRTTTAPSEVLSEHFQERMRGRRLLSAIITTFCFDPGFFEDEVLPVFFDLPWSHAPAIKRLQVEDALRALPGSVAVYYDRKGIDAGAAPARLDVRRFPISERTGLFHPKNIFALVENVEADETGHRARTLLVACLSANLTRSGWWENVEVAHVEELPEGASTRLRDDLLEHFAHLRRRASSSGPQLALDAFTEHVRGTTQRSQRSADGMLHAHFHSGRESLLAFLERAAGRALDGLCLEIVSPYFDGGEVSEPLRGLLERFTPPQTRIVLPLVEGEAKVSDALHAWVKGLPGVTWSELPREVVQRARADGARDRFVHAKVYRFFEPRRGGREILFVGSANLTTAAHRPSGRGGNLETGFLVEVTQPRVRPDFWSRSLDREPLAFDGERRETEGLASTGGTQLSVRFDWERHRADVFWDASEDSPRLDVEFRGAAVFSRERLPSREWTSLSSDESGRLEEVLRSTSLLTVRSEHAEPGVLLVQEEGMAHRPSLLLDLSPAEILRYWSLLTPEQRAAFVEAHARLDPAESPLVVHQPTIHHETLFDRFAGIFHAFECLERSVRESLDAGRERDAEYRLFGRKYDSLGTLLDRVIEDATERDGDPVEAYVVLACAKQVLAELRRPYADFFAAHVDAARGLTRRVDEIATVRARLGAHDAEMPAFLEWFEHWFVRRAAPVEVHEESGS